MGPRLRLGPVRRAGAHAPGLPFLEVLTEPLPEPLRSARLPRRLLESLAACLAAGLTGRALAGIRADPSRAARALEALVTSATVVTGLSPDELLTRTDLGAGDLRGQRVDAALAELRAVCFLDRLGFERIVLLKADDARRRADLLAEREGERWAVDARCASRDLLPEGSFRRGPDGSALPFPTLFDYLLHCRRDKEAQLSRTMADEGCARCAVAVALEGDASGRLQREEAARAWMTAGGPAEFRFGLMPGLLSPASPDDALVPAP